MKNIFFSIVFIIGGFIAARSGILNIRPKLPSRLGFHKKVNWDHFGRQLTTFSGIFFIVLGLISLFRSISENMQ